MLTNILFFYSHFLKPDIPVVDFVYFRYNVIYEAIQLDMGV